jgi:hypothetical protein
MSETSEEKIISEKHPFIYDVRCFQHRDQLVKVGFMSSASFEKLPHDNERVGEISALKKVCISK